MEFFWGMVIIAGITYSTAMLPGPDMAVVLKNSLLRSRRDGIITALGGVVGTCLYVSLALAGLGVVITQSVLLFAIIKYCGAAYIIYLGARLLQAQPATDLVTETRIAARSSWGAFREGLVTNLGNPKFLLFLLGIFTQVIDPHTPLFQQIVYGAEIPIFAFLSFSTIVMVAGTSTVRNTFSKGIHHVERFIGAALILLGIKVALSSNT